MFPSRSANPVGSEDERVKRCERRRALFDRGGRSLDVMAGHGEEATIGVHLDRALLPSSGGKLSVSQNVKLAS